MIVQALSQDLSWGRDIEGVEVEAPHALRGVGKGCPSPHWVLDLEGGCFPSQKIFEFLISKWLVFVHLGVIIYRLDA